MFYYNKTRKNKTMQNIIKPRISIIMPFYNSETFIKNAVVSIINQSYDNWELIAVDDGSKDSSNEILESFKDPRIKICHKSNGGYATAINHGLNNISGDYFLMIGSDDQLLPGLLSEVSKSIEESQPDMFVFRVIKNFVDNNNRRETDPQTLFANRLYFNGSYSSFYKHNRYEATFFAVRDTGKIFKTSLLGNLRYFGKYGFDSDGIFSLLFSHRCKSFYVLPYDGYLYNIHSNSLCGKKKTINQKMDRLNNDIEFLKILIKMPKDEIVWLDYHHAKRGTEVIDYFYANSKSSILKYYFPIIRYYHYMRKFCRKYHFKLSNKKGIIRTYFPMAVLIYKLIKHN